MHLMYHKYYNSRYHVPCPQVSRKCNFDYHFYKNTVYMLNMNN